MGELPSGVGSVDEVRNKISYFTINKDTHYIRWNKGNKEHQDVGYIKGKLLGFSTKLEKFTWNGAEIETEKFSIWLENNGELLNFSTSLESPRSIGIMNALVNIPLDADGKLQDGILYITSKAYNDNATIFMNWNDEKLRWRYEWAKLNIPSELTDEEKKGRNAKAQTEFLRLKKNERIGQVASGFFETLNKLKPFDIKTYKKNGDSFDPDTGEVIDEPVTAAVDDDDPVPF
jgi:hypothetical protein